MSENLIYSSHGNLNHIINKYNPMMKSFRVLLASDAIVQDSIRWLHRIKSEQYNFLSYAGFCHTTNHPEKNRRCLKMSAVWYADSLLWPAVYL